MPGTLRVSNLWARYGVPGLLMSIIVLAVAGLVVFPLSRTIAKTFWTRGSFDLDAVSQAVNEPSIEKVAVNTALLVLGGSGMALAIGTMLAWLNERTNAQLGWLSSLLPMLPFLIPPVSFVIGLMFLFSPTAGLGNLWIRDALAAISISMRDGPFDVYSSYGVVLASTIYLTPFAYLPMATALRTFDTSLEHASRIAGAGHLRTYRNVTIPGLLPAFLSSALLVGMMSLTLFSVPVILGTSSDFEVLSVRIYRLLNASYPPRQDAAVILSLVMLLAVQAALFGQLLLTRRRGFFTQGGVATQFSRTDLGRARLPVQIAMVLYFMATSIIPTIAVVIVSLLPFWTPHFGFSDFTLRNYHAIWNGEASLLESFKNSFVLAAAGASISVLLSSVLAILAVDTKGRLLGLVESLATLPAAIPHTMIGVSFISAFAGYPFDLQGSMTILVMAFVAMYLPQGVRAVSTGSSQVGRTLLDASAICGASRSMTYRHIMFPLLLPYMVSGWMLLFVLMFGEITASALLSGPRNPVLGFLVLNLFETGSFPRLAALAVGMLVVSSTLFSLGLLFSKSMARSAST